MDFSRLHTYTPPQCVPENTGYTYALSSSYSSDALDFETEHKLEPVFDSPRMSRRSLRLVTTASYSSGDSQAIDSHISTSRATPAKGRETRTVKQRRSASKPAFSINHLSGKGLSSSTSHDSSCSLRSATVLRHPVLDESLIREQTKVDHFWGLDDDGDLKGGNKAATQGNGELAAEVASSNGYTCRDCRMLSARTDALTAHSAIHGTTSRVYSRDRTLKPRKAASGTFWWLGSGWYQFVTLISWLNVFLLTRCLRNICKVFVLLLPLLLLLGAGVSLWGQGNFFSLLPVLNWTAMQPTQRVDDSKGMHRPGPLPPSPPPKVDHKASQWPQESDMGQKVASLSAQCHNHDERLAELTVLLQKLQIRVDQVDDGREGLSLWVKNVVGQHLQEMGTIEPPDAKTDFMTFHHDHEVRLSNLEDVLKKLTEKSEAIQKELEETKLKAGSRDEEQPLLDRVQHLELELNLLKSQLSDWQHLKSSCEQVSAGVRRLDMNRSQKKPSWVNSHLLEPISLEAGSVLEARASILSWLETSRPWQSVLFLFPQSWGYRQLSCGDGSVFQSLVKSSSPSHLSSPTFFFSYILNILFCVCVCVCVTVQAHVSHKNVRMCQVHAFDPSTLGDRGR
uniref:SUN domain-containing protein n=1 Tax=Mus spicilegus TaxID=10103 RepID=A0A8C6G4C2_MUSSI